MKPRRMLGSPNIRRRCTVIERLCLSECQHWSWETVTVRGGNNCRLPGAPNFNFPPSCACALDWSTTRRPSAAFRRSWFHWFGKGNTVLALTGSCCSSLLCAGQVKLNGNIGHAVTDLFAKVSLLCRLTLQSSADVTVRWWIQTSWMMANSLD